MLLLLGAEGRFPDIPIRRYEDAFQFLDAIHQVLELPLGLGYILASQEYTFRGFGAVLDNEVQVSLLDPPLLTPDADMLGQLHR